MKKLKKSERDEQDYCEQPNWDRFCTDCLYEAVMEYVQRAGHPELHGLVAYTQLRLTNPCTEWCNDDCTD